MFLNTLFVLAGEFDYLCRCFMKTVLSILITCLPALAFGQVAETPLGLDDGGGVTVPSQPSHGGGLPAVVGDDFSPGTVNPVYISSLSPQVLRYDPFVFAANPLTVNAVGIAPVARWDGGMFYASGSRVSLPGMMGHESGALNFVQELGPLRVHAAAGADKYGYFGGLATTYSVSGDVTYTFSDVLSLTVFGSYYSRNLFLGAAQASYVGTATVGAYFGINFSDHWGVDVGARSVYQPWRRGWETRPIVAPYYKFDNGMKIEVDVGGILYETLKSRDSYRANPTMGPPIPMGPPPVRPHP